MKSVMETNPEAVRERLNSLKSRYEQEEYRIMMK